MSLKYSCNKNKFTKRSIYTEMLKTLPTEENTFIQKEASKRVTSSKIRGPKENFPKLI